MNVQRFSRSVYLKIIRINDSPHKIAGGFALGVFLGILPGAGPIASVVGAYLLQVNRAAALAGSLLTNFWFSVVAFAFAIKIGAYLTGSNGAMLYDQAKQLVDHFSWKAIAEGSTVAVLKPLMVGYAVIGLISGIVI